MPKDTLFDNLPLPVILLLLVCLLMLTYELGYRFGGRQRSKLGDSSRSQAGTVIGSLFALSAFFLAFTFNNVNSRYDARKQLVIAEANAIGTAYLRAQLLPQPQRADLIARLQHYVDLRLLAADGATKGNADTVSQAIKDSEATMDVIWQKILTLQTIGENTLDPVTRGLFIEAVNEVIDIHTKRLAVAIYARLPAIIMIAVGFTIILSVLILGYQGGLSGLRSIFVVIALSLSLSFVCILIISLERPEAGHFNVNQQSMLDLKAMMSK